MKPIHYLVPASFLALTSLSEAATIIAKIHDITASTTQDYVFTEGSSTLTLRAVYTATNSGNPAGSFTSLDGATRVGNSANTAGDTNNHFTSAGANSEGFTVTFSLLSSTDVDTSTIEFSFDSLGVRELGSGANFSWVSSSTSLSTTAAGGEQLETLDTATYNNIANADYTGTFSLPTSGQLIQLSDRVAGGNGVALTANFSTVSIPEPSSTLLLGLGGLALTIRRRK